MVAMQRLLFAWVLAGCLVLLSGVVACGAGLGEDADSAESAERADPGPPAKPGVYFAAFGQSSLVPLRLHDGKIEALEPIEIELADGGHSVTVESDRFYSIDRHGSVVERRPFADVTPRSVDLPFDLRSQYVRRGSGDPFFFGALWVRQRRLFVGAEDRVDHVNFDLASPRVQNVWREKKGKAVDFFVPIGDDKLVAIDNTISPNFAIGLDVGDLDQPAEIFVSNLPEHVDGKFVDGIAIDRENIVYMVVSTHRGGRDHYLYRAHSLAQRLISNLVSTESFRWGRRDSESRFVPREDAKIVGGRFSELTGIDRLGERVFLAANERGILSVDRSAILEGTEFTSFRQHLLEGRPCYDVRVIDDMLFALLECPDESSERTVIAYRWNGEANELVEFAQKVLDTPVTRLSK